MFFCRQGCAGVATITEIYSAGGNEHPGIYPFIS